MSKIKSSSSTSSLISSSPSKGAVHPQSHSFGGKSPRHGAHYLLSQSSGEEADSDLEFKTATSEPAGNRTVQGQQKEKEASAQAVGYAQNYSFGKRENIISGREPKLPRSLLEGRRSDRMLQVKGRMYNEEDWFDDSKFGKQAKSRQA
ncbi:hypothetical protein GJ744_006116 [Endocarpon pusillum]|uniref:Uncharacterized protein n=1 Tax=Endocarpon pusillum TaxID=364733 RepID=A0A8H7AKE9_9EURO|nr:hypothetical protein GJ744_006116 [Endocarpon pusillum]